MKKVIGILFLILILISGFGFIFPEQLHGVVNLVSPSYSWAIMGGIWIVTLLLAVVFVGMILTERKDDQVGTEVK